ncbi:MAG: LamG domain-containing protein, partial [Myxococcales bacterium]|nr:LamG domain-containing protein [Myxococcales bacterium]
GDVGDGVTQAGMGGFYAAAGSYTTAIGGSGVNDGAWHHLVGVHDNGTLTLYVDGAFAGTGSGGASDNGAHLIVGGLFNGSGTPVNAFSGEVDEVAFYDLALTAAEVTAVHQQY